MLRLRILFAITFLLPGYSPAQDVILKRNADEIRASVSEITDSEVKYRLFESERQVIYSLPKSEIFSITYPNGEKDLFPAKSENMPQGGYPLPIVRHTYQVGDIFQEDGLTGLVIRTTDGGRHGLILSLDYGIAPWGCMLQSVEMGIFGNEIYNEFIPALFTLLHEEDGWENTQQLLRAIEGTELTLRNFPAFSWCRNKGKGWYLPAAGELKSLLDYAETQYGKPIVTGRELRQFYRELNARILAYGGRSLSGFLWSSTERSEKSAAALCPPADNNYMTGFSKEANLQIRAVHKF